VPGAGDDTPGRCDKLGVSVAGIRIVLLLARYRVFPGSRDSTGRRPFAQMVPLHADCVRAARHGDLRGGRVLRGSGYRCRGGRGGDEAVDGCASSVGGAVVQPGERYRLGHHLDLAEHREGDQRLGEPGADQGPVRATFGPPDPACGDHAGAGCLLVSAEQRAEVVQPPGGGVDPDPAGSFLRRHLLVGGHAELDPEAFGRAEPPQRAERAVCPVRRALPHFLQAELEQQRGDDWHEPECLGRSRTAGCMRPVEEAAGGDQAPHGQPGRQTRLGPCCPAH